MVISNPGGQGTTFVPVQDPIHVHRQALATPHYRGGLSADPGRISDMKRFKTLECRSMFWRPYW